nr:RNA-dependent RNA polymerase [Partitiviridae sp.]
MRTLIMNHLASSKLLPSIDSGANRRLARREARLTTDKVGKEDVVIDKSVRKALESYVWDKDDYASLVDHYRKLTLKDGLPFCSSLYQFSDLDKRLDGFRAEEVPNFGWNEHYRRGRERVRQRYLEANLRQIQVKGDDDVLNLLPDLSTSSGWEGVLNPEHAKKAFLREDAFASYMEHVSEAKSKGSFGYPIVLGTRTQVTPAFDDLGNETEAKRQSRAVCISNVWAVLADKTVANPISEWYHSYSFVGHGKDDEWITHWHNLWRNRGYNHVTLDYSKFDSTQASWLIRDALYIIREAFRYDENFDDELWKLIVEDKLNKVVCTGDGRVELFTHGNTSGNGLTAVINDVVNEIILESAMDYAGITKFDYNVTGDDVSLFISMSLPQLEETMASLESWITHNLGIKVGESIICTWYENPKYLSRLWTFDGPYRHPKILVGKMLYPEKDRLHLYKNGVITPETIIYAYILGYELGMRELMDVDRFLRDNNMSIGKLKVLSKEQWKVLPYNVKELYSKEIGYFINKAA